MTRRRAAVPAPATTRQQLVDAALDHIRSEGLSSLTVRSIADRAGANVAAVNYHFGSKEALVDEVLQLLMSGLRSAFAHLSKRTVQPRERLRRFLREFSSSLLQHPDVYRQALAVGATSSPAQQHYLMFLRAEGMLILRSTVREVTGEPDNLRLTLRVLHAIGGLAYPLLIAPALDQAAGVRLAEDSVRRECIAICLDTLLRSDPKVSRTRVRKT